MSNKKSRERAAKGEVIRDGKISRLVRCPVPDCSDYVITGNSAHGLCPQHEKWLAFVLWVLPNIRPQTAAVARPGAIILPGQPGFQILAGDLQKQDKNTP